MPLRRKTLLLDYFFLPTGSIQKESSTIGTNKCPEKVSVFYTYHHFLAQNRFVSLTDFSPNLLPGFMVQLGEFFIQSLVFGLSKDGITKLQTITVQGVLHPTASYVPSVQKLLSGAEMRERVEL